MTRYGSVCSGIEAASAAWHPLGWEAAWLAEIEKFPSKVLAHHYPTVPNLHDMRQLPMLIAGGMVEAPDVLVGGTPCQAFSVAGLRNSLEDDRGQLSITFIHTADAIDTMRGTPCVVVWENVPGVLNTKDNAFGCFLAGLVGEEEPLQPPGGRWTDAGYVSGPTRSAAWRVLDAQYFGVAQRRRRVFVVASARDGFDPCSVLFESEGVRRDTAPSREAGQDSTRAVADCFGIDGEQNADRDLIGTLRSHQSGGYEGARVAVNTTGAGYWQEGFGTLRAREQESHEHLICMSTGQAGAEIGIGIGIGTTLNCNHEAPIVVHGTQDPCTSDIAFAQGRNNGGENVVSYRATGRCSCYADDKAEALRSVMAKQTDVDLVSTTMQVRRLTPTECERLQGFPDGYTNIPGAADGPRYKALGNSMAVPVMNWIGRRIVNECK